jgi:hypothetical protein
MIVAANWVVISSLATAVGTLVLAMATFASVRSANNAARTAERSFEIGLVPLLFPSRLEDPAQKIRWGDDHWVSLGGGRATMEILDGNIYLAMSLRNVGSGTGVLHAWRAAELPPFDGLTPMERPALEEFHPQSRDLFVPAGDMRFWQAAVRDPDDPYEAMVRDCATSRRGLLIDVLYSDYEGGQRTISRFSVTPRGDEQKDWLVGVVRHWNLDRPDPRGG